MSEHANQATLEEVKWKDVREAVTKVNPELAAVIDDLKLNDNCRLYKAKYPFGSTILKEGIFYCPTPDGLLAPLDDHRISSKVREDLSYAHTNPPAIALDHSVELFMKLESGIMPLIIIRKGKIFGLWRALDPDPLLSYHIGGEWHMVAGARSIFMLPKITDSVSYKKLSRFYQIKHPLPPHLLDHQAIFTQMAQSKNFPKSWSTELLFFSAEWFKARTTENWIHFDHFLLKNAWDTSQFWRNKFIFDFMWDSFVMELSKKNNMVKPYIVDIVKHLIIIALGVLPGFAPALDNEYAPINQFQEDFIEIYGLKNFAPVIMVPQYFNQNEKNSRPIYWSLQLPYYFRSTPKPRTENSIMEDLRDIKRLLDLFINAAAKNKIKGIIHTPIERCIETIQFDYFHSDPDPEDHIRLATEIPKEDNAFIYHKGKHNNAFSQISPFIRGCIRISHKKS